MSNISKMNEISALQDYEGRELLTSYEVRNKNINIPNLWINLLISCRSISYL